jgi:hypothetical protein
MSLVCRRMLLSPRSPPQLLVRGRQAAAQEEHVQRLHRVVGTSSTRCCHSPCLPCQHLSRRTRSDPSSRGSVSAIRSQAETSLPSPFPLPSPPHPTAARSTSSVKPSWPRPSGCALRAALRADCSWAQCSMQRRSSSAPPSLVRTAGSVALACKGPLNARLATGVGLSFFLSDCGPGLAGGGGVARTALGGAGSVGVTARQKARLTILPSPYRLSPQQAWASWTR